MNSGVHFQTVAVPAGSEQQRRIFLGGTEHIAQSAGTLGPQSKLSKPKMVAFLLVCLSKAHKG